MSEERQSWTYDSLLARIKTPELGTVPLIRFFRQHYRDLAFVLGLSYVSIQIEDTANIAGLSLIINCDWKNHPIGEKKGLEAARLAAASMAHCGRVASEIVKLTADDAAYSAISRYADNLNCYLSDLLELALTAYPNVVLDSDSHVSVREVLQHSDMESVREWLIDRKVADLSFQGLGTLESYCEKQFGFKLFPNRQHRESIAFLLAARNLVVHRRAIIDRRFRQAIGDRAGEMGSLLSIEAERMADLICISIESVVELDKRAVQHFKWPTDALEADSIGKMRSEFLESVLEEVAKWGDDEGADLQGPIKDLLE